MRTYKLGADKIICGENAIEALSDLPGTAKRAYIVMSGTIQEELGQLDTVTNILEANGWSWMANTDVEPEPCWGSVERGVRELQEFKPDWIIGFGGGSAMDAAKAMWVFYENPHFSCLDDAMPPAPITVRQRARICCIATSAGTGSECTRAALIKDPVNKRKYSIREYTGKLIPDVAILDPAFSVTMPARGTAACGMDALTHAIESYVSTAANAFSDAQAIGSWIAGYRALATCVESPDDLRAREEMLVSSCLGGIAFTNSALGVCHGIAHSFGATFNIPHGLANGITLPYSISFNRSRSPEAARRYDDLARFVGVANLEEAVLSLRKKLGIPHAMCDVVPRDEFEEQFESLVQRVMTDVCTPANPVTIADEDAGELVRRVYYGE